MKDKVLRRLQSTVQKVSKSLEVGEGFDGQSEPYIVEGRMELYTDTGLVFGFELTLEGKEVIGNMAMFQVGMDGQLIPLDIESLQMIQQEIEEHQYEEMKMKLN